MTGTAATILIVEDDQDMRDLITAVVVADGHDVRVATSGMEAFELLDAHEFDLALLDVMMPGISGFEVLDHIRGRGTMPVILLTSLASEENKVRGFRRGADDYLTKPFSTRELSARIDALLRRSRPATEEIVAGPLRIDLQGREVWVGGVVVETTAKEFDLLAYLAARPGRVYTRHQLLRDVWGSSSEFQQEGTVTEHVRRLRSKLEPAAGASIQTVRGVGYRFDRRLTERPS
jgi:DNA-binding response OmpR family regulator